MGRNLNNNTEISARCKIVKVQGSNTNELIIDDFTVMIWTDWIMDNNDFHSGVSPKISASFRCSEITHPKKIN